MSASLDQFRSEYDEESLGMLSDILSTLYQNPERSVLREYIANGIDAHRISGYDGPVEVTLPSPTHPKLVIRDHGDGLSREDMQRVYFSYVRSTKRDDDTQIGALGLGAKSAFALTKSWTVTNIHDGREYIVASVNDDYGAPQQTVLVNGAPTDKHSGITVTIPISDRHLSHKWAETANSLAVWLPKGSVVINGSAPFMHWTRETTVYGNSVMPNPETYSSREFRVFQAIMGGIGYVVDDLTKDAVREAAAALLYASQYDTDEVRAAMAKHPKSSLSKVHGTSHIAVAGDETEKDRAREGYAHASIRDSMLSAAMDRPLKVDLGDVDFMPSRESVKGTPRTISALAQAVAGTVEKLSADVIATRAMPRENRVKSALSLAHASSTMPREMLTAVGVHDTDTNVFSIGVGGSRVGAHAVVTGASGSRVLVTGVAGTALYKGKMYARSHRVSVYVIDGNAATDTHLGDLSPYFTEVIPHERFKSIVAAEFPANRGGTDTRHRVWVADGLGAVDFDLVAFSELEDHLDGIERVFIADDDPYRQRLVDASQFSLRTAVVVRGRRKFDIFVKALGEDVVADYAGISDVVDAHINSEAVRIVTEADRHEVECVLLAQSEGAKRATAELLSVFDSPASELVPDDHRARKFVASYVHGIDLKTTYRGAALHRAVMRVERLAQDGDKGARAAQVSVDTNPWPLMAGISKGERRSMTHAAMYLAAVG